MHARITSVLLMAVGLPPIPAQALDADFEANFRTGANLNMARLRSDLLGAPGFDKNVPPESNRCASGVCYSNAGTDVDLQIRFFKVQAVEAASGSMRLKVWVRMAWTDTRLAWNETAYGGISTAYFSCGSFVGAEDNEIWIPDLQPYNGLVGTVNTLEPAQARVSSTGRIFFSRPGTLEVMCKFSGLVAFPFDKLSCPIEVGGWGLSGGLQGVQLLDGGFAFSNQELTSGTSYQEYEVESVNATLNTYTYPCCPSEPWPIVMYRIQLKRASDFYVVVTLIPGILLTMLSFVVFWTPTGSADPLGYGISVVVVNVLSNIVLMDMLPVCGEMIWIDMFSFVNTAFCCLSLLQSAICIMLENNTDSHFLPMWLTYGSKALRDVWLRWTRRGTFVAGAADPKGAGSKGASSKGTDADGHAILSSAAAVSESVAGVIYRRARHNSVRMAKPESHAESDDLSTSSFSECANDAKKVERLIFFESLFFKLDQDSSMFIDREECDSLLSFTVLSLDPQRRDSIMNKFDRTGDGKLNRSEFCLLCVETLWNVPFPILERALGNLQKAKEAKINRNRVYWGEVADRVDSFARLGVPALYFLALIVVFNVDLRDEYETTGASGRMFAGINGVSGLTPQGPFAIVAYIVIVLCCGVLWVLARRAARKSDLRKKRAFFAAGRSAAQSLSSIPTNELMSSWEQHEGDAARAEESSIANSPEVQARIKTISSTPESVVLLPDAIEIQPGVV